MTNALPKNEFLALYREAHNNALDLLGEAELLFSNQKYARAYALAFTALEEISKSQLAADVFTGLIDEGEFWDCFRNHKKKIGRMAWATADAQRYLDEEGRGVDVQKPTFAGRLSGMYTGFDGKTVAAPKMLISQDDANSIIHTVRVALDRIVEVTEYWGHQIGTKGFMK
jgi:AbiV family abortive infection protein